MKRDVDVKIKMAAITRVGILGLASSLLLLGSTHAGRAAPADALTTVNVVNTASRMADDSYLPVLVGQQEGFFKKYGLDVTVTVGKTSQIAAASLISGRADIGLIQPAYVVSANAAGSNFKMIGSVFHDLDYSIVTSKDITSLQQLEGKVMAGAGPNNGNTAVFRAALEKAGVNSGTLTYATVGVQSAILAAMVSGQAQAGLLSTAAVSEATADGLINQGSVKKYLPNQTSVAIATTQSTLTKESDTIRKFMMALSESNNWVIDNPPKALAILAVAMNVPVEKARPTFEGDFSLLEKNLSINTQGLQDWINISLQYKLIDKSLTVADVYTPDYLPK